MKVIPYFLVAGAMALGTACSSTNTGAGAGSTSGANSSSGASSTSGADAGTSSGMGAGSSSAGGSTSGSTGTSSSAGAAGTGSTSGSGAGTAGTSSASGAAAAADPVAFMGTFATMQDPVFLINAASSNLLELQAGQLATQKASTAEARKYAQMMISHHTKATQDLKTVATPLGTTLPQTLLPVHQAMFDRLANKTGKDFDEAYLDLMETAHKMDIAMFEVKSRRADTPVVQAFASRTLPMLRSHQTMANNMEKKVD